MKLRALIVVVGCCFALGCASNRHVIALEKYEAGTKLATGDVGKTGFCQLSGVSFRYDTHRVFESESDDFCELGVGSDKEILCVEGERTLPSADEAIEFALELDRALVKKYKSGLKDYGAEESKYYIHIDVDGKNVSYVVMTAGFKAIKDKYESYCDDMARSTVKGKKEK